MRSRLLVTVLALAVLAAGCGRLPVATDRQEPSTARPEASRSADETGETFEGDIRLAARLGEDFWRRRFAAEGANYRPLREFVPYRSQDGPACGGEPALPENAFYCPDGHFVAFDEPWMRGMYDRLGDASAYLIILHEIGHAVQAQTMSQYRLNVERELQADCYAGGALGSLVAERRLGPEEGDDEELLVNLAAAGDPTDAWWRPDAHGTAEQRQQAFTVGYNQGVGAC
ncbi:neutral zinc metallopeptidase [Spongiactinospora sp. TRM90649]|uniref:neutral zinc metallopeptidase n=1 Tax=Spongiactinospora sp. TRM90649 TaxID=3031114 RepID=UPI0023F805E9|nr:neutral zinc metallopeptidase [Spongiactinospora sp. TRM90649]MDF5751341.1 neutral zinc metallopeptidase [Spongiactinospora sp. TRM90649]